MTKTPTATQVGVSDVSEWGEKDVKGLAPKGATWDLPGGKVVVADVPDIIGAAVGKRT